MKPNSNQNDNVVRDRFRQVRGSFLAVAVVSFVVNLLMLTGPIFMLQVYDRVLASQSVPTLIALLGLAMGLYTMMGIFDFLRIRVLSRVSYWLDNQLSPLAFRSWMVRSLDGHAPGYRPVQDLTSMRAFFSSPTILAVFDLPWFPFYLAVVFILHVQLGFLATGGAVMVICLALLNELLSYRAMERAGKAEIAESRFSDQVQNNADSVLSMGMLRNTTASWQILRGLSLTNLQMGSERSEIFTAMSKSFRLLLQSVILGLGAYLAIQQEISPGMIVAASIIAGRALAPIDQTIGGWRAIKRARLAHGRLRDYLSRDAESKSGLIKLPDPEGHIHVSSVSKFAPGGATTGEKAPILSGLNFKLKPGDGLGVIGPSAAGKSTLAKLLVGLWTPDVGSVRIDGSTFDQWEVDEIGRHIGYLPQEIELISGTIAQNISRFETEPDEQAIVEAAKLANVHEMILSFPDGYATNVDTAVSPLTGGQRQRIALARAVYRTPKLVVLDEPNSNLDPQGDEALAQAVRSLREAGSVVVVMAHRPSAIASVDFVLMLKNGTMTEFGSKADVIRKMTKAA